MIIDPINPLFCFIGLIICPIFTLAVILFSLGHPALGCIALFISIIEFLAS